MAKRYAEFILRHKWKTVFLSILWVLAMGTGLQHFAFTNDYRVFFGEDNPQLVAFENLQDTYARNDNVMFVLAPEGGQVFKRKTLGAVAWLTERAWETPFSTRVDSLTNYQHTSAEGDDLLVDTHGAAVIDPVWDLLDFTYRELGVHPTLLERDFNIPPLEELVTEVARIASLQQRYLPGSDRNHVSTAANSLSLSS